MPAPPEETAHEREVREWAEALAAKHPPLTQRQLETVGGRLRADAAPIRATTEEKRRHV